MIKRRRYDYVAAMIMSSVWSEQVMRRSLRKLVRHVVAECRESANHEALDGDYADRIAKELIP